MSHPNEIALDGADERLTDQSFEIMRVWATHNGGSPVWIRGGVIENPETLGRLFANAMLHASRAHAQATDMPEAEALAAIRKGAVDGLDIRAQLDAQNPTGSIN